MALTNNYSFTRPDWGTLLGINETRGLVLNKSQVEVVMVSKLTGDTSATITLADVQRPSRAIVIPIADSAGAVITAKSTPVQATFVKNDYTSAVLSGLGTWTAAFIFFTGRSYKTS